MGTLDKGFLAEPGEPQLRALARCVWLTAFAHGGLGVAYSVYEFKFLALLNNVFIGFCASSFDVFILSISNAKKGYSDIVLGFQNKGFYKHLSAMP
ncbi:MAG: hypothetical protein ACFB2X_10410 [Rivularia sp. (in: cyanobacteria)]